MKHIVKILTLLVTITAFWKLLYFQILPIYFTISLGCYGLLMVGVGLIQFRTCPEEAVLLQKDVLEAKEFLKQRGVDVGSD
ncbi:hypothetical protein MKW98_009266 [Papaver atlanticum]|uniref:Dolichol-phosphate mannosyltransferase subunit 3 n=1 Tax=Papaver atlanticum TaxID=357466 RepID=A0AAD4T2Y4_9MAGN|nr:hypothetical protein MKW98_009266 [Papaver atlanticum]